MTIQLEKKNGRQLLLSPVEKMPLLAAVLYALHIFDAVDEGLELAASAGVTELAKCLRLYLANALAGDLEGLADLFEGVFAAVFEAEAHLDHTFFSRR
jgi:hypothetical protein